MHYTILYRRTVAVENFRGVANGCIHYTILYRRTVAVENFRGVANISRILRLRIIKGNFIFADEPPP